MTLGDALIVIALVLLFVEIVKSTRTTNCLDRRPSAVDLRLRRLPGRVPAGASGAAHSVFFILMVISLVDVLAGFSVSLRSAGRDVNIN